MHGGDNIHSHAFPLLRKHISQTCSYGLTRSLTLQEHIWSTFAKGKNVYYSKTLQEGWAHQLLLKSNLYLDKYWSIYV